MTTIKALNSSESVEWYTPAKYIAAVRDVLGGIDLDPASCPEANLTVRAKRFFTQSCLMGRLRLVGCDYEHGRGVRRDGLTESWNYLRKQTRSVFLNPPYGRSGQRAWSAKLLAEYRAGNVGAAILLVNVCTSEKWFQPLWQFPICFTDHRIQFVLPEKMRSRGHSSGTKGSAVVFLPDLPIFRQGIMHNRDKIAAMMSWGTDAWLADPVIASFIGHFSQFGFIYLPSAIALSMRDVHAGRAKRA